MILKTSIASAKSGSGHKIILNNYFASIYTDMSLIHLQLDFGDWNHFYVQSNLSITYFEQAGTELGQAQPNLG